MQKQEKTAEQINERASATSIINLGEGIDIGPSDTKKGMETALSKVSPTSRISQYNSSVPMEFKGRMVHVPSSLQITEKEVGPRETQLTLGHRKSEGGSELASAGVYDEDNNSLQQHVSMSKKMMENLLRNESQMSLQKGFMKIGIEKADHTMMATTLLGNGMAAFDRNSSAMMTAYKINADMIRAGFTKKSVPT